MKMRRYQVRDEIEVNAPIERVYAIAADPESVPSYAPEIAKIELVKKLDERSALVRSHLRIGGMTFSQLYKYHYNPPTHYSGVQENGRWLRGYFSLAFEPRGTRTIVSHTEGILSAVPFLASLSGFIYFRILARGGLREELGKLKSLTEEPRGSGRWRQPNLSPGG
jgi:hypothetical protein